MQNIIALKCTNTNVLTKIQFIIYYAFDYVEILTHYIKICYEIPLFIKKGIKRIFFRITICSMYNVQLIFLSAFFMTNCLNYLIYSTEHQNTQIYT